MASSCPFAYREGPEDALDLDQLLAIPRLHLHMAGDVPPSSQVFPE